MMGRAKVSWACDPCGTCRQERSSQLSFTRRFLYGKPLPAGQFKKRHPGEVSVRCLSRRSGNLLHVDVEADVLFELLQAEHISMTALKWRESRCMFYSSPRKNTRVATSAHTAVPDHPAHHPAGSAEEDAFTPISANPASRPRGAACRPVPAFALIGSSRRRLRPPVPAPRYPSTVASCRVGYRPLWHSRTNALWCALPSENEHGDPSSISVRPHFFTVFRTERSGSEVKQLISRRER